MQDDGPPVRLHRAASVKRRKLSRANQRRAAAYHEAAHAVMDELAGITVYNLVLGRHPSVRRAVWPDWISLEKRRLTRRRARVIAGIVTALFAGRIAEELWLKYKGLPIEFPFIVSSDYWKARWLLESFGIRLDSRAARRTVTAYVQQHWVSIDAVARAALKQGRLTGDEVRRAMTRP